MSMPLEKQVCSLELSQKLEKIGVKQDSLFYYRLGYCVSEKFDKGKSLGREGEISDKYSIE